MTIGALLEKYVFETGNGVIAIRTAPVRFTFAPSRMDPPTIQKIEAKAGSLIQHIREKKPQRAFTRTSDRKWVNAIAR